MTGNFLQLAGSMMRQIGLYLVVTLGLAFNANALQADRDQPINMSADQADLNDVTQEYVLTGNVVLIKGSLRVEGDKAVVVIDPEGYQSISVVAPPNQLAKFRQRLDGPGNEITEGYGDFIFYDEKKEQLLIRGNAVAKKRAGSKLLDQIQAETIEYALDTERYRAISSNPQTRVRTMIAPTRAQENVKLMDKSYP